jgi:hypothetical protein
MNRILKAKAATANGGTSSQPHVGNESSNNDPIEE